MRVYTVKIDTNKEAFKRADLVIEGQIIELGIIEPEGAGKVYFYNTKVKVISTKKGKVSDKNLSICYEVYSFKDGKTVDYPKEKKKYKFYIEKQEEGKTLFAFLITDL